MKNQSNVINVVVAGVLALCFLFSIVGLIYWLINAQQQLLAGLVAGLIPSAITVWQYRKQAEREHQNWLLRDRNACLVEIIRIFFTILSDNREKKGSSEKKQRDKLNKQIKNWEPALFAHGSAATLKAWNEFQIQIHQNQELKDKIRYGERFFRAIRKDLGRNDKELRPGELWASFLKLEDKQKALDACAGETYK